MTASELIAFLQTVPPMAPIRASYDAGCAWGWVKEVRQYIVASTGDVEVELEVD